MNAWLESLTGVTLRDPWLLMAALGIPLGLGARRWRGRPAVRLAAAPLTDADLPRSLRARLCGLPPALNAAGLLLAVVALARPVERTQLPLESKGIDILLCLDVSSSMAAHDLDPVRTRLDVAKAAAAEFVGGRPHDRIGLVTFARYPDLQCPPTLDHRALEDFLTEVERVEVDGAEDQTGIGTAVARAAGILRDSRSRSKVVILLTDGEENVATLDTPEEIGPLTAARWCEELGVRAYTIAAGIGRPGPEGGWVPVDTRQVKRLAEISGGTFFEARDAGAVAAVYASINELETVEFEEPRYRIEERFLPFLIAAVTLLLCSRLLAAAGLEVLP